MHLFWMVVAGCFSVPDWVAPCAADCAEGHLCTVAAEVRCVKPPPECPGVDVDGCREFPSPECAEAVCGQSSTYTYDCWLDDQDVYRNIVFCDGSGGF